MAQQRFNHVVISHIHKEKFDQLRRGINAQPFTSKLGEWRCVGKNQVVISTADYTLQVPGSPVIILIFIGLGTHQTTGIGMNAYSHSIPTIQRGNLNLEDPYISK
ncbi:unnamed protein product [Rotaria sp. Silwood1]|nr:unnamed protein product [Rotaria sp. Silwood1]CAF4995915.1 unnamed protein product [Rotaria sp. Silwood1]